MKIHSRINSGSKLLLDFWKMMFSACLLYMSQSCWCPPIQMHNFIQWNFWKHILVCTLLYTVVASFWDWTDWQAFLRPYVLFCSDPMVRSPLSTIKGSAYTELNTVVSSTSRSLQTAVRVIKACRTHWEISRSLSPTVEQLSYQLIKACQRLCSKNEITWEKVCSQILDECLSIPNDYHNIFSVSFSVTQKLMCCLKEKK